MTIQGIDELYANIRTLGRLLKNEPTPELDSSEITFRKANGLDLETGEPKEGSWHPHQLRP